MGVCGGRVWDEGAGIFDLCFTQQVLGTSMDCGLGCGVGSSVGFCCVLTVAGWPAGLLLTCVCTYHHQNLTHPHTPTPSHKIGALPIALLLLCAPVLYARRLRPKGVRRGAYAYVCIGMDCGVCMYMRVCI
jgi:hypothetical protein